LEGIAVTLTCWQLTELTSLPADPVHRRRPQPDQVHSPARPLAQRSLVE
jgi:hypothetical protein